MAFRLAAIDHVQLAMPTGEEAVAESFYSGLLGLDVVPKPEPLASRGGRWFETGEVRIHLGSDPDFRKATKAHPALLVDDLDDLVATLVGAGVAVQWDGDLPGVRRCHVEDPWGNRIELIDASAAGG